MTDPRPTHDPKHAHPYNHFVDAFYAIDDADYTPTHRATPTQAAS